MNRKLFISNLAVVVMAVVGLLYTSIVLVDVNPFRDDTVVVVEMSKTGGLFAKSEVTYRGNKVGKIRDIRPRLGGIEVEVALDEGVRIPKNTAVVVSGLSPVGEQTLDFRPRTDSGPYLGDGDRVPATSVKTPIEFHRLVTSLDGLVGQVDIKNVHTVVDELFAGTRDAGPEMRRLLGDTQTLIATLTETLPETRSLLSDGGRVLETVDALTTDLDAFSRNARRLTRSLRSGEPDFTRLATQAPPALDSFVAGAQELTPVAVAFMNDAAAAMAIVAARIPAFAAVLEAIPVAANMVANSVHDGVLNAIGDAAPSKFCRYPTPMQVPWEVTNALPDLDNQCTERAPDLQQRGSQNAPR